MNQTTNQPIKLNGPKNRNEKPAINRKKIFAQFANNIFKQKNEKKLAIRAVFTEIQKQSKKKEIRAEQQTKKTSYEKHKPVKLTITTTTIH